MATDAENKAAADEKAAADLAASDKAAAAAEKKAVKEAEKNDEERGKDTAVPDRGAAFVVDQARAGLAQTEEADLSGKGEDGSAFVE